MYNLLKKNYMKRVFKIAVPVKPAQQIILVACLLITLFIPVSVLSQTDSTTAKASEGKSLISPTIEFISTQKGDNTIDLKAILKAKIKRTLTKLYGMKISFSSSDSSGKELGKIITDRNGMALLNYKADGITAGAEGKLHFKASFAGNKSAEAAEEELIIKRAKLVITPVKGDSILSVQVKLVDLSTSIETAIPETGIGVFVKRWFSPLKIGEGKTNENGEVIVDVPKDLPGDAKGNITLLARLDDNEQYGNLEAGVTEPWGSPVSDKIQEMPRALWSPNPPLWMLITFIILVTVVWGHYIVIVYELFRLRKEQPKTNT